MGWMLRVLTRRRPGGVLLVTVAFTDVEMLLLECDANVSGSKALEKRYFGGDLWGRVPEDCAAGSR